MKPLIYYFVRGEQASCRQPAPFSDIGSIFTLKSGDVTVLANDFHYGALNTVFGNKPIENWGDSGHADNSQQTDTSTNVDNDDRNELCGVQYGAVVAVDYGGYFKLKPGDHKVLMVERRHHRSQITGSSLQWCRVVGCRRLDQSVILGEHKAAVGEMSNWEE